MFLFTLSGPLLAALGFGFDVSILFWIGIVLCSINLFMNIASGATAFPAGILVFALIGGIFWTPWFIGAAVGLAAWTAIEAAGDLWGIIKAG